MKKEHKHCLKRVAAAALVMLMVSGTVPFQPIAEVFDTAIVASAETAIPSDGSIANSTTGTTYVVGHVVSSSYETTGETTGQTELWEGNANSLFDGKDNRFGCNYYGTMTINFSYDSAFVPKKYYIRNWNDCYNRNMKSWTLQAKDANNNWVTLDTQKNSSAIPEEPKVAVGFALNNNSAYKDFRITNVRTGGRDGWIHKYDYSFQLSEIYFEAAATYTITWKNDNGSVIDTTTVSYGDTPTHAEPTKEATENVSYTFSGWTPEVTAVTGNAEYTATFAEIIHHAAKAATCIEDGHVEYWSKGGKNYSDSACTSELDNIVTPATGHTYGEPTWNWNGTESATATFVCEKGDDTQTVNATITSNVTTAPTYTEVGKADYTATAEFNGKTYTDTKNVDVEMLKRTDISSAKITLSANSFDYDGSDKTVTYTVKVGDKVLTEGTDFTFEGDTTAENVGVYIIKVKGVDDYEGTAQTTWKIVPPEVTVKINSQPITQAYSYNNSLTVTAPKAESGKKFSHWEVDGNKVSYSETYSFIVKKSVDLIPVYVDVEEEVEQQAVLNLKTSQTKYNSKNAIEYTFTHSIPNGYTVKEVGLLYATNKLAGADTTKSGYATVNLVDDKNFGVDNVESAVKNNTSGKVKKYVASYKNLNGTVTFSYALGDNTTAYTYAVGYVKVVKNGVEETLYTNFVATDYNSANT